MGKTAFENDVDNLMNSVKDIGTKQVIIAGDFNAKSVMWGSPNTDAMGEYWEEWMIN